MDDVLGEAARLVAEKNWPAALEALHGVEATEGNQSEIAYLFGITHARLGHWDDALLYLEQVVTGSDEHVRITQSRLVLAYIYSMTGRHKLAEYEIGRLRETGFESVLVYAFLGYSAWGQGKIEEGIEWYAKALALDPENANALNGMGYLLACKGTEGARALTYCRKAVDKSPDNPAYLDSLAWAYHKLGFSSEARVQIERALAISSDFAEIREHARAIELEEGRSA